MTNSDKIQLALLMSTSLIGIISLIISIFTLKSNNKMIEESTRPIICAYSDIINNGDLCYYIIIKNFGLSGAVITDFYSDFDFSIIEPDSEIAPFENIVNLFMAPNQKIYTTIFNIDFKKLPEVINIELEYKSTSNKIYRDKFKINTTCHDGLLTGRTSIESCKHALKVIAQSTQASLETDL